jgi:DNA-binding NarL/FixJ family response regulator
MEETGCCRVMVVEESPIIRSGLTAVLAASNDLEVVGEAADGRRAVELAWRLAPDVVLLDAPRSAGDTCAAIAALSEISRVIMLTEVGEPKFVLAALCAGAVGYLIHDTLSVDELVAAIRDTVWRQAHPLSPCATAALIAAAREQRMSISGKGSELGRERFRLSTREIEVMELIVQGHANSEIAAKLYLTEKSVKNYTNRIYAKLGVHNRATAILKWLNIERRSPRQAPLSASLNSQHP